MIRFAFDTLKTDIRRYQAQVESALREYDESVQYDAKWYREELCEQRREVHLENARQRVKDAEEGLANACRRAADKMRDCLKIMTNKPVDPGFLENMRTIREFGIKLDETELPTYINQAAGNLTALRVLGEVVKASGLKLQYAGIDEFNADIKRVETFGAKCQNYAPEGMWNLALEALPDAEFRREDGSVSHSLGRPTITSFILGNAGVESMLRDCDGEMLKRWTGSEVPSVEAFVQRLEALNDDKPADWHKEYAEIQHERAVDAAARNISAEKEKKYEKDARRTAEDLATYQRIIAKYK